MSEQDMMAVPPGPHNLQLPPTVARIKGDSRHRRVDALDALESWAKTSSNVAIVFGRAGAGKSYILQALAKRMAVTGGLTCTQLDFEQLTRGSFEVGAQPAGSSRIHLIDNFDAINSITGIQTSPPDLSSVSHLLHEGHRLVLATRRQVFDEGDDLGRQLSQPLRSEALGAVEPFIIEMLPWKITEIEGATNAHTEDSVVNVARYLRRHGGLLGDEFLTPLTVRMLALMGRRLEESSPTSLARVYDEYVGWALTRDYDRRQSAFKEAHKRRILANIAYDIFCGQQGTTAASYSVSRHRLVERVMEVVSQDPLLRSGRTGENYQWAEDFLSTNHILTVTAHRSSTSHQYPVYAFEHPSFFEYFVAQAIAQRVSSDSSLGIQPNALSEATFRSMTLYFVRENWDADAERSASAIVRRRLTWPDRLLFLYMLEMAPDFGTLLRSVDQSYLDQLSQALPTIDNFFVRKAIRYQLVIAGRLSPWEYIQDLRRNENEDETSSERWLLSGRGENLTNSLITRMNRPDLRPALPIAVYRLGQMGEVSALETLRVMLDSTSPSSALYDLIQESIEKIVGRNKTEGSSA